MMATRENVQSIQAKLKAMQKAVKQARQNYETFAGKKDQLAKLRVQNQQGESNANKSSESISNSKPGNAAVVSVNPTKNLGLFHQLKGILNNLKQLVKFVTNALEIASGLEKPPLKVNSKMLPSAAVVTKKLASAAPAPGVMARIDTINRELGLVALNTAANVNMPAAEKITDFNARKREMAVANAPNVPGFVKTAAPIPVSTPDELRARIIRVKSPTVPTHTPQVAVTPVPKNVSQRPKAVVSTPNTELQKLYSVVTSRMTLKEKSDYIQGLQRAVKVQNAPSPLKEEPTPPLSPRPR
jgi:hypothetical protein